MSQFLGGGYIPTVVKMVKVGPAGEAYGDGDSDFFKQAFCSFYNR